jgi:hypothetical protein
MTAIERVSVHEGSHVVSFRAWESLLERLSDKPIGSFVPLRWMEVDQVGRRGNVGQAYSFDRLKLVRNGTS